MSENKHQPAPTDKPLQTEEIPSDFKYELGTWWWVKLNPDNEDNPDEETMCCIMEIGSNYIKFESVGNSEDRVHNADLFKRCRPVEKPLEEIQKQVTTNKDNINKILGEIRDLSRQLALTPEQGVPETSTALMRVSGSTDLVKYKNDLELAKKKLPELQEELKDTTEELTKWMTAEAFPLQCQYSSIEKVLDKVEERIFHVKLYGGLLDDICQFADGVPASDSTPIHVLQRVCFMDEECLIDYHAGGMNFEKIGDFCKWMKKPKNRDRLLPFPRCLVSFQVRREDKDYNHLNPFVAISFKSADIKTYLFIRNGEKLYYVGSGINFKPKLFPNKNEFNFTEIVYAKMFSDKVDEIIPEREYQDKLKEYNEKKRLCEKWEKENPKKDWIHNPYHGYSYDFRLHDFHRVDGDCVYLDDVNKKISDEAKAYNRIVLILQGLLDRSEVFNPHLPIRLYKSEDFTAFIKLIYDEDHALYQGVKPDFEAYRNKLNKALKEGAWTIGQLQYYMELMTEQENERPSRRGRDTYRYTLSLPYGNPGPGEIAQVDKFHKRSRACSYKWQRQRMTYRYYYGQKEGPIETWARRVPANKLLCLTNYQLGDYKQFFADPRTRQEYLKWAPFLLAAEDWKAGKRKKEKDNE